MAEIGLRSIPEPNSGCWLWMRSLVPPDGRAQWVRFGHKAAYRISYEAFVGDIPRGLRVLHSCDNPACVNPEHLSVGTQAENMQQCARRGRIRGGARLGENHHNAKLTREQIRSIRQRTAAGESCIRLAAEYGVSDTTIYNIRLLKTRKRD